MKQLSGLDGLMMLGDMLNFPLHIGALFIYDPSSADDDAFSFDKAQSLIMDVIEHQLPILKCKARTLAMSLDNPYWVTDPNFSLSHHIERVALPAPADWQQVYELASTFHARPLQMDKPLWEAMYIEGLDGLDGHKKGCVGLLLKLHHAVADGKTAMRLFNSLHTLSADTRAERLIEEMPEQEDNYELPGILRRYSRAYWHNLTRPVQMSASIAKLLPVAIQTINKEPETEPSSGVPRALFNGMPSAERVVGHLSLNSRDVRKLAKKTGVTINDIALCVIGGAMREWLDPLGELPEESLVAGMPIDTRRANHNMDTGNQFNVAMIKLQTQVASPKHRLQAIADSANASKSSSKKLGPKAFTSIVDSLYPAFLRWGATQLVEMGLVSKVPPLVNTLASNVPGLQAPVYLNGAKLVDYIGLGFLAPTMTLFHVISSTEERINISFVGSPDTLTDAAGYNKALQDSYDALVKDVEQNS